MDEFMQYKGLNDNKITVQAKIAVGTLGKQRRSGKGLSYDSIVKILRTYPELNPAWLMLGEGEMLKKNEQPPANLVTILEIVSSQNAIIKKQHEKKSRRRISTRPMACGNQSTSILSWLLMLT